MQQSHDIHTNDDKKQPARPADTGPQRENTEKAREEAERDMERDAEFTAHSPNDELDEGETARLGENTDLI